MWINYSFSKALQVDCLKESSLHFLNWHLVQSVKLISKWGKPWTSFSLWIYSTTTWRKWPSLLCHIFVSLLEVGKATCSCFMGSREKLLSFILIINISCSLKSSIKYYLSLKRTLNPFSGSYPMLNKFYSILGTK